MTEFTVAPAPGSERGGGGRRVELKLLLAVAVLTSLFVTMQAPSASAALFAGTPPVVDGRIDGVYAQGDVAVIDYNASGDDLDDIQGQLSVIETADAFYVAFQQPFSAKSNAYCRSKGNDAKPGFNQSGLQLPGCYQTFSALNGSDYIALDLTLAGKDIHLPMDIITPNALGANGHIGTLLPTGRTTGEGGTLAGCPAGSVTGFSGMSYNWNQAGGAGWGAETSVDPTLDSPNHVGLQAAYPDYVYASTAEWKIDRAACGLTGVTAAQFVAAVQGDAHNSPAAPFDAAPEFVICPATEQVAALGAPVSITATAVNPAGASIAGRPVAFFVQSGPGTITGPAAGDTNAQGQFTVTASTATAGRTVLLAFLDLDRNGQWNAAVEPISNECPFSAQGVAPTYTCVSGTATGPTSATINASTTDPAATSAVFTLTPGGASFTDSTNSNGSFSVDATALQPNTDYTVQVLFQDNAGATLGTGAGTCPFKTSGNPDLEISKSSSVTNVTAGGTVTFTITATNTGAVAAQDVAIGDEVPGSLVVTDATWSVTANAGGGARAGACAAAAPPPTTSVSCQVGTLDANDGQPGGADTAVVTIVAQTTTASCPQVQNQATVSASNEPAANQGNNTSNIVTVMVTCPISIDVVKVNDADGDGVYNDAEVAPTAGADVPFRATITNTGDTALVLSSLTDVFPGIAEFPVCNNLIGTTLAAGASVTCDFTVAGYAPALGSNKVDTVTVVGVDANDPNRSVSDSDTSSVSTPPGDISVQVVKDNDANGDAAFNDVEQAPRAGSDVPFRAVITNTSQVPVVITSLTDVWPGFPETAVCPELIGAELAVGQSVTCLFSVLDYAPAAGSSLINTVSVTVVDRDNPGREAEDSDTSEVTTPEAPEITVDVVKTNDANGDGAFNDAEQAGAAGQTVPFQAVVTNTSEVAVSITSLTDVFPGQAPFGVCAELLGTVLQPGQSVTCSFSVQGYAPAAGSSLTDVVAVTVADVENPGSTASDEDDSVVTTPELPVITVEVVKTNDGDGDGTYTDVETAPAAGDAVPFRAVITNTSAVPVRITDLTDVYPGQAEFGICANLIGTVLASGESVTCSFTVQGYAPAAAQSLTDTVRVDVVDVENPGSTATDSDDSTVNTVEVLPSVDLAIDKDDAGATFTVGQAGTYTIVVTNVGDTATTGPITVTDTLPTGLTYAAASGTSWSCSNEGQIVTCTYTNGALAPGQVAPTITVTVNVGAAAVPQVVNPARVSTPNDINPNNDNDEEPTPVIQVFGNPPVVRQTPPVVRQTPTPTPAPTVLARTGTDATPLAGLGAILVLVGALLLLATRRRSETGLLEPAPAGASFLPAPARQAARVRVGWAA